MFCRIFIANYLLKLSNILKFLSLKLKKLYSIYTDDIYSEKKMCLRSGDGGGKKSFCCGTDRAPLRLGSQGQAGQMRKKGHVEQIDGVSIEMLTTKGGASTSWIAAGIRRTRP